MKEIYWNSFNHILWVLVILFYHCNRTQDEGHGRIFRGKKATQVNVLLISLLLRLLKLMIRVHCSAFLLFSSLSLLFFPIVRNNMNYGKPIVRFIIFFVLPLLLFSASFHFLLVLQSRKLMWRTQQNKIKSGKRLVSQPTFAFIFIYVSDKWNMEHVRTKNTDTGIEYAWSAQNLCMKVQSGNNTTSTEDSNTLRKCD